LDFQKGNFIMEKKSHLSTGRKQKILIIEDEATLQKALQEILLQENYEVISALDGKRGLEMALSEAPNMILLDLILPKMDGFEVLKDLKKDEKTKEIPIIILTNLGSTEDVQKALVLGATNYMVKADHDLSEIVEKIKGIIGQEKK
jgi:DNA-binding response OmpR family regulator